MKYARRELFSISTAIAADRGLPVGSKTAELPKEARQTLRPPRMSLMSSGLTGVQ